MPVHTAHKRAAFRKLHESGCFVIPNPWDAGSARMLQHLGFKALASTSAGFAWSQGRADYQVTRDMVLSHLRDLVAATDLPVNADFENAFADDPAGVAANVLLAEQIGVAGLSMEDSTPGKESALYDFDLAVARVAAAAKALAGTGVVLTARCEAFLWGVTDLTEVIRRLKAYSDAGADCLYAPGLRDVETIKAVVQAVAPKPVNILTPGFSVAELEGLGVRRISVGGNLARAAWGGFLEAAKEIAGEGTFTSFAKAAPGGELNKVLGSAR